MTVIPRRSLDDYVVENMTCAICGQPSLEIKHVNNLPDFVACTSCQAAFLVEEGGARVLYGQIPDSYPETKRYALKKWLLRQAIDLQALKERPVPEPRQDLPASPPTYAEDVIPSGVEPPPATEEPPAPSSPSVDPGPPSFSGIQLGDKTPAQGAEPLKPPSAPPPPASSSPQSNQPQSMGGPLETPVSGLSKVDMPQGLEPNLELPEADQFPPPDPNLPEMEQPEWLRPPADRPAAPQSPEAETVHLPEDPFSERFATQDEIESLTAPPISDSNEVSHGIDWPSSPDDDLDQSNLPDWLRPDSPETQRDKTPDLTDMPGVPIPTEPLSEPADSGIALESQPRIKPRHYDTLPPQPGTPAAAQHAQKPADLPPVPAPASKEEISRPIEDEGPGFELTPNDPKPGERYRVVIKGVKVQLPTDFCAHCGRTPVKGRVVVIGSLPSSKILGQRQPTQFNVPLCEDCYQRSQHPKEEVQSARLQASLVSTLVAVVVLVLGLVFGLVNLQSTSIPNLMILLVLAAIGYAIPAVILFGRIQDLPVTPEMHYIQTTLIFPSGAQGLETAFEWRNPLYAQRFAELNQQNVVGAVSQVKQRPMT